jgi:peptidoglycan hydrolase-like protein with peptidoglycan-binding domain
MLQGKGVYKGAIDGNYGDATIAAVRAYRKSIGWQASDTWSRHTWMQLMTVGPTPVVKYGSARSAVRRLQRALNASGVSTLSVSGVMTQPTVDAVKRYQARLGMKQYGVVTPVTWQALTDGRY